MAATPSSSSALPSELIVEIFRFSAASSRAACLALCFVSSWAHRLVLPYLLSTVTLRANRDDLFLTYLSRPSYKPPRPLDPTSLVRSLWLPHSVGVHLVEIVRRCEHLSNIALSDVAMSVLAVLTSSIKGRVPPEPIHPRALRLTVISTMRAPEDLWLRLAPRFGRRLKALSPLFGMVTHLRLWLALPTAQLRLTHFTRLTHLAVRLTLFTTDLLPAFERALRSRTLERLVVEWDFEVMHPESWAWFEKWLLKVRRTDKRLCFAAFLPCSSRAEWREEVDGGENVWERAVEETEEWEANYNKWGEAANIITDLKEYGRLAIPWVGEKPLVVKDLSSIKLATPKPSIQRSNSL